MSRSNFNNNNSCNESDNRNAATVAPGSVDEAGQLLLTLNEEDLAYTVVGRATGASQIVGMAIVTTTVINSILTVRNPSSNSAALTITPLAGGTRPVSAHLIITQIG